VSAAVTTNAAAELLPPGLLDDARGLHDGLLAVLAVRGVDTRDAAAVLGDTWVASVRLTAASWRRSGRLGPGGEVPPITGVILSLRLDASTMDSDGRHHPGNIAAVLGQVRRLHPDAASICGCSAGRGPAAPSASLPPPAATWLRPWTGRSGRSTPRSADGMAERSSGPRPCRRRTDRGRERSRGGGRPLNLLCLDARSPSGGDEPVGLVSTRSGPGTSLTIMPTSTPPSRGGLRDGKPQEVCSAWEVSRRGPRRPCHRESSAFVVQHGLHVRSAECHL
jgi:hypothetical protein